MIFSKSIAIDDEEIGGAAITAPITSRNASIDPIFVDKLRAGDAAAFDTLVDRFSPDIYALLYRLTENAEEAGDLTQETFMRALRSIKSFRGDSELKTWLYRIAINESRNRFRWWKRRKRDLTISLDATIGDSDTPLSDTLIDRSISPEDAAQAEEREYALKAALLDLPEVFREAIVLCDVEGLSYEETAAALGISPLTVRCHLEHIFDKLRVQSRTAAVVRFRRG